MILKDWVIVSALYRKAAGTRFPRRTRRSVTPCIFKSSEEGTEVWKGRVAGPLKRELGMSVGSAEVAYSCLGR